MYYWRLCVHSCKGGGFDVLYKTEMNLSKHNVTKNAVLDGDLLDSFMYNVDIVESITKEVYYEHMYD